jgi:omega-hydroxy-beta-dihydromenaquinone-9 sulfotransferase
LTAGFRLGPLMRLLGRNHITYTPKNLLRILFLMQSGFWSTLFSRVEQIQYGTRLHAAPPCNDPIFIVGHWRTGSTLLHQLMNEDPALSAPTLFQVALPEHFLTSYNFYRPVFGLMMDKTRPMDNVAIGINEPQEDEYAWFRLTGFSPLENLIFPKKEGYFLRDALFVPPEPIATPYFSALKTFYTKLGFATHSKVISKNPFNSFRIPELAKLFPGARFIHIVRHPYHVVPSTRHLWTIIQKQNILNKNKSTPTIDEISLFLKKTMETVDQSLKHLPSTQHATIRYEDLTENPLATLSSLYGQLDLPFSDAFQQALYKKLESLKGYTKNRYLLTKADKNIIENHLQLQMEVYNYERID